MTLDAFLTDVARARGAFIDGKHLAQVRVGDTLVQDSVTNLLTNPSFETAGALVEVRRNLAYGAPGAILATRVNDVVWGGNTWYQFTATTSPGGMRHTVPGMVDSQRYVFSVEVANPGAAAITLSQISVADVTSPAVTLQPGERRVVTATAARAYAGGYNFADVRAPSGTVFLTRLSTMQLGPVVDSRPFDHTVSPDPDLTPSATGTPGASASILRGTSVASWSDSSAQIGTYQTADSPASGSRAARSVFRTTAAIGITPQLILPVTGGIYTLILHVRPKDRDLQARARIRGSSGALITFPVGVWTEVRLVAAAGNGTDSQTGLLIAAASGHQIGDRVDTDLATLIAGNYTGKPASGDSPGWAWDGTPHNSTSHGWR